MPEGMYTSISIEDNGCGIEKENIHRIFDSHFTTDKENGMGIGLRSVKKSVDQHSGYIFVDSSVEQNSFTRFTMFLPMSEMVSESQKKSSIPPTPILVINEDASISESLSRSISHFGGKCMAPDCSTDIVWLIANAPQSSVVILNNELSDQKEYGTNTARWIKNKRPDLSIFLSTIGACMDSATLKKEGVICGLFQRPFINPLIKGLSELQ